MHYFTEYSTEKKVTILLFVLVIIFSAIYYNNLQTKESEHILKNEIFFEQGKVLECYSNDLNKELNVSQKTFTYSRGTQIFIGKQKSPYYNVMINIRECE